MKQKKTATILAAMMLIFTWIFSGCGVLGNAESGVQSEELSESAPQAPPLVSTPPLFSIPMPTAPGVAVAENDKAVIDYSNTEDGYVIARYVGGGDKKVKVIVDVPSGAAYTYPLETDGSSAVFPLSDGNGNYTIGVYEQVEGMKYAVAVTASADVVLADEFAPFLRPSLYVNYNKNSTAVKIANGLMQGTTNLMDRIAAIYNFVVENIAYDMELAENVQTGYIPDIDKVMETGTGICFDYAVVMTAMLRSQGIPTKLIFGYTGEAYHAWINVYSEETGWIDEVIFFDGKTWKLMDPTFASTGGQNAETLQYIGDGTNYTAKYQY